MDQLKTAWKGVSNYFIFCVLTCCVICMHFGFYSWILYSPEVLMYFFFNVSRIEDLPDQTAQLFFLELAIDLFPLGALVGSLLSGYVADRFGRKGSIMVSNVLNLMSVILLACDTWIYVYEFTICTHLLSGICLGINFCLIYLYLFEISPRPIRGSVVMLTDVFVKLGNVISQLLTVPSIIGYQKGWYLLVFVTGIIPVVLIILLPKLSETPRYLMIQREDEDTARNVLSRLTVSGNVEEDIEELRQERLLEEEEKKSNKIKLGTISSHSQSLFSVIFIMAGSQIVGFHELYYHNQDILQSTKLNHNSVWILKTATSFFLCLTSLLAAYLIDYVGRRILYLTGLAVCMVTLILMVMALEFMRQQMSSASLCYICISLLLVFTAAFSLGPNMISVIISLEMFLQSSRASGVAFAGSIYCVVSITITLMQDKIKKELGSYSLLIFSPFCVALFIYFYLCIPETKNQTLKDIQKIMEKSKNRKKVHVERNKSRKVTDISL